ncbi:MAG: hypothetical protein J0H68_01355 [Sphingobacteriia bacterium]|nr:hypothetical protein [Sphingobacteriia bacterium]
MQISEELKNEFEKIRVPSNKKKWQLIKYCSSVILGIISTLFLLKLDTKNIDPLPAYYTILYMILLIYPAITIEILKKQDFNNKRLILKIRFALYFVMLIIGLIAFYYLIQWNIYVFNEGKATGYYPKKIGILLLIIPLIMYESFRFFKEVKLTFSIIKNHQITEMHLLSINKPSKEKYVYVYRIGYEFMVGEKVYTSHSLLPARKLEQLIYNKSDIKVFYNPSNPNLNILL